METFDLFAPMTMTTEHYDTQCHFHGNLVSMQTSCGTWDIEHPFARAVLIFVKQPNFQSAKVVVCIDGIQV